MGAGVMPEKVTGLKTPIYRIGKSQVANPQTAGTEFRSREHIWAARLGFEIVTQTNQLTALECRGRDISS